jgi:hypothetical protein
MTCAVALVLTACGHAPVARAPEPAPAPVLAAPSTRPAPVVSASTHTQAPAPSRPSGPVSLPAPGPVRSMNDVRLQAAKRLVAAHPDGTYMGKPPDVLLAIPVLEAELNADGSIKRIQVMRYPGQAPETTQMAIDALKRAAPFGDVSRVPKPWKFVEVFLFNNERRFKPRTLDN